MSFATSVLLLFLAAPKPPAVQYVNPPGLAKSPRYSHVAVVHRGKMILVSGQIAQDAQGNLVGAGDMVAQSRQVFENLKTALTAAGASFSNVVQLTTYVVDIAKNIEAYRSVREEYLRGRTDPPASTTVGVSALVREGYLLEVEAIAVVP
jgi:enamine deaminase RidA (YjgF/YER057c/UK114 family)